MDPRYRIENTDDIISPTLIVFREILESNIARMIEIAGDAARLRPHAKTHKTRQVAQLLLAAGIGKHKCATFPEAEMLADAGAKDIFLAYNLVGPNIGRAVKFRQRYPDVTFSVTADHQQPIAALGKAISEAETSINVLLDIDPGLHRTGLEVGAKAKTLYRQIAETAGLTPGGLHLYDGQNRQTPLAERSLAVEACWNVATTFRDELVAAGYPVPRIAAGGTGSFPIYAAQNDDVLELCPGTVVFYDSGYERRFPDLNFTPAALLLTRVISRPTANRVTFDLGHKACAADPPAGDRLYFPDVPDAKEVLHSEEHLVLETSHAEQFQPGDETLAIPRHICPTTALHRQLHIVSDCRWSETWEVTARDRRLTI